ncbi:D-alanyl-D-alanine carboxypeptidase [Microcystis phage MJing1]|nr:D-alanyl-D-alanine carboxypeptidase [Microcystis phage MJing1]
MSLIGPIAAMRVLEKDAHWSSVRLLVGADDAITDESPVARALTAEGGATRDTAGAMFSKAALRFNSLGDVVWAADSNDLSPGNQDFTLEFSFSATAEQASFRYLVAKFDTNINQREWAVNYDPAIDRFQWRHSLNGSTFSSFNSDLITPASFFNGSRRTLAVTRSGSTLRMFVDGVLQASTFNIGTSTIFNSTARAVIGGRQINTGFGDTFVGLFDEVRFTIGVARYTASYTPRTTRFPRG